MYFRFVVSNTFGQVQQKTGKVVKFSKNIPQVYRFNGNR